MPKSHLNFDKNPISGTYTTELKCSICKKRCRTENGLQKHFESEHTNLHDSEMLKCGKCSKRFKTKSALDSHVESEHSNKSNDVKGSKDVKDSRNTESKKNYRVSPWVDFESVIKPKKGSRNLQMYKCKLCDSLCFTIRSIQKHLKRYHKQERNVPMDCVQCNRTFADEAALRRHLTMQHKNDKTNIDGRKKVDAKNAMYDAKNDEDLKNAGDEVDEDLKTNEKTPAKVTNGTSYDGEGYNCEFCSRNFATVTKMATHMRGSHSQRKMHAFLQTVRGYRKFRIHSTVSAGGWKYGYQCVNCKKRANSRKKIMEHIQKEHKIDTVNNNNSNKSKSTASSATTKEGIKTSQGASQPKAPTKEDGAGKKDNTGEENTQKEVGNEAGNGRSSVKRRKRYVFGTRNRKPKTLATDPCHCFECGVVLKTEWALEEHYKNRHSGPNYQVVPKFSVVKGKYNLFLKCLICEKICRSKGNLKQHLKDHDRADMKTNSMPNSLAIIEKEDDIRARKGGSSKSRAEKRKRNVSCIYHCRVCGESFPRLFSYSEHKCTPIEGGQKTEDDVKGGKAGGVGAFDVSVACKRLRVKDRVKIEECDEADDKQEMKPMETGDDNVVNGRNCSSAGTQATKQNLMNRSPWKVQDRATTNSQKSDTKKVSNFTGKSDKSSKFVCRFCKRPFSNQKHLARHEQLHSEANLLACSNCGMSFTAMHKLRYHSMRCMQNKDASKTRDTFTAAEPGEAFNGRVDGNTYPSFAKKSEYTYFDPANRPDQFQGSDPSLDEELNTAEAVTGPSCNSKSPLDSIVIADVRSCNPAFSNEKLNSDKPNKGDLSDTAVPIKGRNLVVPSELVPGYYLDGIQIPYVPIDGVSPQNGTLNVPQTGRYMHGQNPHGMYAQGTVFLVPYFVPAQEMFSKDGRALVTPKQASLPPGGFMVNPQEFNARFSPVPEQRLFPISNDSFQTSPTERLPNTSQLHDDKSMLKSEMRVEKSVSEKHGKYDCSVCNKTFATFGNYIKHREVHRR